MNYIAVSHNDSTYPTPLSWLLSELWRLYSNESNDWKWRWNGSLSGDDQRAEAKTRGRAKDKRRSQIVGALAAEATLRPRYRDVLCACLEGRGVTVIHFGHFLRRYSYRLSCIWREHCKQKRIRSELMRYYGVSLLHFILNHVLIFFAILAVLSSLPSGWINLFINVQLPLLSGRIFYYYTCCIFCLPKRLHLVGQVYRTSPAWNKAST